MLYFQNNLFTIIIVLMEFVELFNLITDYYLLTIKLIVPLQNKMNYNCQLISVF